MNVRQTLVGGIMVASLVCLWGEQSLRRQAAVIAADPAATSIAEDPPTAAAPIRPSEKHIKAYSGLAALAGIVIAGLALAALIILWAGRLRRQLRRPLPDCGVRDRDFWFLKPPKPTVTQSSLPASHQPPHISPTEES